MILLMELTLGRLLCVQIPVRIKDDHGFIFQIDWHCKCVYRWGVVVFFYKFTFISLITGLYCGFVISKSLWNSTTKSWLTFLDEFVSDLPRKDGRITTLVLLYLHHHGGRGYFRFTSAYRTSPVTHNWVDVWSWKNWNQNHLISLT